MANLVSASGTRVQAPDSLVGFLKSRGFKVVDETAAPAPSEMPLPAPEKPAKPRTRKPRVTTPESN